MNTTIIRCNQNNVTTNNTASGVNTFYSYNGLQPSKNYVLILDNNYRLDDDTDANGDLTYNLSTSSEDIHMFIQNDKPTVENITISPKPAENSNDLTCNNGSVSSDSTQLYYVWYNSTSELGYAKTLSNTATKIGYEVICSVIPSDELRNGTAVNSTVLVIGDTIPPYNTTLLTFSNTNPCTTGNSNATINISDISSNVDTAKLETLIPSGTLNVSMTCTSGKNVFCQFNYVGYSQSITIQKLFMIDLSGNTGNRTIDQDITFHSCTTTTLPAGGGGGGSSRTGCGTMSVSRLEPESPRKDEVFDLGFKLEHVGCNIQKVFGSLSYDSFETNFTLFNVSSTQIVLVVPDVSFKENFTTNISLTYIDNNNVYGYDDFRQTVTLKPSVVEEYDLFIILLLSLVFMLFVAPNLNL